MASDPKAVAAAAYAAYDTGICVLPPREDGSKRPFGGDWKPYQLTRSTPDELDLWYGNLRRTGIGAVTGATSGNLEVLDFDNLDPQLFYDQAEAVGLGDLVQRIRGGYEEQTPSGGTHLLYRCSEIAPNLELAKRPPTEEEAAADIAEQVAAGAKRPKAKPRILVETRGEGGYIVLAPSNGKVHDSGGAYRLISGGFASIVTITPEERRDLHNLARLFNTYHTPDESPKAKTVRATDDLAAGDTRPGKDFDKRISPQAFVRRLEEHGWRCVGWRGEVALLRRPGKSEGLSATYNLDGLGLFYSFSSSTEFEAGKWYTPFRAVALLEHNSDYRAAAKALAAEGYGTPRTAGATMKVGNLVYDGNGNLIARDPAAAASAQGDGETADADATAGAPDGNAAENAQDAAGEALVIDVTYRNLPVLTDAAWDAILKSNDPERFFTFGGDPVRIAEVDGAPVTQRITTERLRYEASIAAAWVRTKRAEDEIVTVAAEPPMSVIENMLAVRQYPLSTLQGIVQTPIFAPDGTLPTAAGYHAASKLYYAPAPGFTVPAIPAVPSAAEIEAARSLLCDDLIPDFPFTTDAERANALAMLLLPFMRGLIDGPTPLHLIEKPVRGTGASKLANLAAILATGRDAAMLSEGRDDDEWAKRLLAVLRRTPQVVLIDNLTPHRRLDSSALASVLTSNYFEGRVLGQSETLRVPARSVWIATGNNPKLSSEITRRTVRIRMDAKTEHPELRDPQGFKHPALEAWALSNRGDLVAACLTLGRAWLSAGRPLDPATPVLGSYEAWSRVMGGLLMVAGVPGFLSNIMEFYEASDTERQVIRAFLSAWWEKHGEKTVSVSELFEIANGEDSMLDLGDRGDRSQRTKLGRILSDLRDQHFELAAGTVRVTDRGTDHKLRQYRLTLITPRATEQPESTEPTGVTFKVGSKVYDSNGRLFDEEPATATSKPAPPSATSEPF